MVFGSTQAQLQDVPDVHDAIATLNDLRVQWLWAGGCAQHRHFSSTACQMIAELVHTPQLDAALLACRTASSGSRPGL